MLSFMTQLKCHLLQKTLADYPILCSSTHLFPSKSDQHLQLFICLLHLTLDHEHPKDRDNNICHVLHFSSMPSRRPGRSYVLKEWFLKECIKTALVITNAL